MKVNEKKISGVLNQQSSSKNYQLERLWPDEVVADFVEQFWFVSWNLLPESEHTQVNLPDSNFHLIIENGKAKILGPIKRKYTYTMQGEGHIVGVKFQVGALSSLLKNEPATYIDKEISVEDIFKFSGTDVALAIAGCYNNLDKAVTLQSFLQSYSTKSSRDLNEFQKLVTLVKENNQITSVKDLSESSSLPIRTIQRYFKKYLGITPKWLIRRYRLHQAMTMLEQKEVAMADIAAKLGYTDQSHLIKDFSDMLGYTPKASHYLIRDNHKFNHRN